MHKIEGFTSGSFDAMLLFGTCKYGLMFFESKKEQATLVGKAIAERAKAAGVEKVVFDRGGFVYHGRIKALADGAREGGLSF